MKYLSMAISTIVPVIVALTGAYLAVTGNVLSGFAFALLAILAMPNITISHERKEDKDNEQKESV